MNLGTSYASPPVVLVPVGPLHALQQTTEPAGVRRGEVGESKEKQGDERLGEVKTQSRVALFYGSHNENNANTQLSNNEADLKNKKYKLDCLNISHNFSSSF